MENPWVECLIGQSSLKIYDNQIPGWLDKGTTLWTYLHRIFPVLMNISLDSSRWENTVTAKSCIILHWARNFFGITMTKALPCPFNNFKFLGVYCLCEKINSYFSIQTIIFYDWSKGSQWRFQPACLPFIISWIANFPEHLDHTPHSRYH